MIRKYYNKKDDTTNLGHKRIAIFIVKLYLLILNTISLLKALHDDF